jgi:hypothetical protein
MVVKMRNLAAAGGTLLGLMIAAPLAAQSRQASIQVAATIVSVPAPDSVAVRWNGVPDHSNPQSRSLVRQPAGASVPQQGRREVVLAWVGT